MASSFRSLAHDLANVLFTSCYGVTIFNCTTIWYEVIRESYRGYRDTQKQLQHPPGGATSGEKRGSSPSANHSDVDSSSASITSPFPRFLVQVLMLLHPILYWLGLLSVSSFSLVTVLWFASFIAIAATGSKRDTLSEEAYLAACVTMVFGHVTWLTIFQVTRFSEPPFNPPHDYRIVSVHWLMAEYVVFDGRNGYRDLFHAVSVYFGVFWMLIFGVYLSYLMHIVNDCICNYILDRVVEGGAYLKAKFAAQLEYRLCWWEGMNRGGH